MTIFPDFIHEFVPAKDVGVALLPQPSGRSGPAHVSGRTLLLLHGTGGNERDLLSLGRELDPAAALLSPRGKVSENGRPRFFRRLAEGVFDLEDLHQRTHELAEFVRSATDHYGINPKELIAVGYSNGANIAAAMLLLRPEILPGAILFRPMLPLTPEKQPDLSPVRVWMGGGAFDQIIPTSSTKDLAELLRGCGADVTIRFFQAGHELTSEDVEAAREWLR